MKLYEAIEELTGKLRRKVSYTDIAIALDVTRQYANQIKDKELSCEQLERLDKHFDVNLASANTLPKIQNTEDCISIPVLGQHGLWCDCL